MDRLNRQDIPLSKVGDIEAVTGRTGKVYRSININHYATKKSAAQSMLDVALLMANSSQLKTVLYVGPQYRFYLPLIVLLSLSITLQVAVGLLLVFIGK
nr:PREDICTED: ninjurin-1-like [Paralichthys olivaceus]